MAESMIERLLRDEIEKTLGEIAAVETGSDKSKAALIKLDKLYGELAKEQEASLKTQQFLDATITKRKELDLREQELSQKDKQITDEYLAKRDEMELRKSELEIKVQQLTQDLEIHRNELTQKDAELKEAKRTRRWKTVLDILGIGAPLAFSGWWMYRGMKFEEEGKIYSSRTSQWIGGITRLFKKG